MGIRSTKNITRVVAQQAILSHVMKATDSQLEEMLLETADDFSNFRIVHKIEDLNEERSYFNITDVGSFTYKEY